MNRIKIRGLIMLVVFSLMITLLSVEARAAKSIGVLLWNEEARYIECKKGILEQLKNDGYGEPAVKFTIVNAERSKAKLAELVRNFAAAKMDLIISLGTIATVAVTQEIKDVPVVFSMVYDPVETGIAKSWKSSGNNTTGSSPLIPMSRILKSLKEFAPVKRLAMLYEPGEKQSVIELRELQKIQASFQIKVIPIIVPKKEEIPNVLATTVTAADAIYIAGSTVAEANAPIIIDMANKAKVVTVTHLADLVAKGVLLGVCANPYFVGRLAGKKAVQILKGAKPASVPIETDKRPDLILNMKTAKAGKFQIPPSFMKKVTKTIE